MLVCGALYFVFAATPLRRSDIYGKPWYFPTLVFCALGGLLSIFIAWRFQTPNAALTEGFRAFGLVMLGLGYTGIHIELGRLFGRLGMKPTLEFGVASTLVAGLCVVFAAALNLQIVLRVILLASLLVMLISFPVVEKRCFPSRSTLYSNESVGALHFPARFILTSGFQGASIGLFMGYGAVMEVGWLPLSALGFLAAAVFVFIVVVLLKADLNCSVYRVGFAFLGLGLFLSSCLGVGSWISVLVVVAGFAYLDLILWGLGSYLIKEKNQCVVWLIACPSMALMAGRASGMLAGACSAACCAGEDTLFFMASFVVLFAALLLLSEDNVKTGWGFVRPEEARDESCEMACRLLAEDYALTHRELEIMQRLVAGKTRKEIAEEMFISSNTVKSHVYNLYRKLEVHSSVEMKEKVIARGRMLTSSFKRVGDGAFEVL